MRTLRLASLVGTLSTAGLACSDWETSEDPGAVGTGGTAGSGAGGASCELDDGSGGAQPALDYPRGFQAVGNQIHDAAGNVVKLRGVNRSGTEYKCIQGGGFFDGPADEASVQALAGWPINTVRVPLNESCWLGINGAPPAFSGENYKAAIANYVALLHKYGLIPILELHWAAPGTTAATRLLPMPNADHSPDFWRDVATTFLDDDGVIFEPYNEPFPDNNRDSDAAWQCWRDGCTTNTYEAVGMQALVDVIRETGSEHLLILDGVQFANHLTQWIAYRPEDPLNNLAASFHPYNYNDCRDQTCWDVAPAEVAAAFPLVATEFGQDDCSDDMVTSLLTWFDANAAGYLAWSWNAFGACVPATEDSDGAPWSLITDYYCPLPNTPAAQVFYDHLRATAP